MVCYSAIKQILLGTLLMGSLSFVSVWAWDGNWTQAESGQGDVIYDPDNSQGKAGTTERPQRFFIPPPRDWIDVDPEEVKDYKRRDYTPYALARVTQSISYQGIQIPKGYYVIKPGDSADGSPKTHLPSTSDQAISAQLQPISDNSFLEPVKLTPAIALPSSIPASSQIQPSTLSVQAPSQPIESSTDITRSSEPRKDTAQWSNTKQLKPDKEPKYNVFVIKKLGNVIAVVPIHRMEHFKPPRQEKTSRQALAWLDVERSNGVERPVLKFYYKHTIYSTDFE